MATPTQRPTASVQAPFSDEEMRALEALRFRFQQDHDLLSSRERMHLSFLRWLVRSGRLVP
jgi:hypothetical protein